MSRRCDLTGKGKLKGNQVSHSNIKTIKHSKPNLRNVRVSLGGKLFSLKIAVSAYKSLKKGKFGALRLVK